MIDMNALSNILTSLTQIGESEYTEAAYIANMTIQYTNELTSKQISKDEYDDLMADLKIDQLVSCTAEELIIKEQLQNYTQQIFSIISNISFF